MAMPGAFWRFAASSGASNLADGVVQVALPLLALQFTRSPALIAGVTATGSLPWLLLALPVGVLVDRVDRRLLIVAAQALRVALIFGTAVVVATGTAAPWQVYVLAAGLGIAEVGVDTAAQTALPAIVDGDRLPVANSRLYGVEVTANTFVGPPLGGVLAGVGLASAFAVAGVGYLAAATALLTLTGSFRPAPRAPTARTTKASQPAAQGPGALAQLAADLGAGLGFLWRHRVLRHLALLVGRTSFAASAVHAVLPVYAIRPGPMGLTPARYGLFLAVVGVGALIASLTAERLQTRLGPTGTLRLAIVVITAMLASPLLVHPIIVAVCFAAGAYLVVAWNVITVSYRQRVTPDHLLGRVNSAYRLLAWGAGPIGAAVGEAIGQFLDVRAVFVAASLATAALLVPMRSLNDAALTADA